ADVLAGDATVRADVDDVDSGGLVPEVVNHPREDALRDQRLSEPDFVRDQEPPRWRIGLVHSLVDVVHGIPLEGLERAQRADGVGLIHCGTSFSMWQRTSQIGPQISSNLGGKRSSSP